LGVMVGGQRRRRAAGAATGTGVAMLVAQASAPTQVVCLGPEGGVVGFSCRGPAAVR